MIQSVCGTYTKLMLKMHSSIGADKQCSIPLIQHIQNSQIHRIRKYVARCWGSGEGKGELVFNENGVSVEEGEKFGRWMIVRVTQQCAADPCRQLWLKQSFILCDFYHSEKYFKNKVFNQNFKIKFSLCLFGPPPPLLCRAHLHHTLTSAPQRWGCLIPHKDQFVFLSSYPNNVTS